MDHLLYKTFNMRLTKKHKEIIALALSLFVDEMNDCKTKDMIIEILADYQSKGIWGSDDEVYKAFFPEN